MIDPSVLTARAVTSDGGNVVKCPDCVIMTDKVFQDLSNIKARLSWVELRNNIGCDVVIIPREPDPAELLGHADGMIRHISDNIVLMRAPGGDTVEERKRDKDFLDRVKQQLQRQKENIIIKQFDFSGCHHNHKNNWAYINFLRVGNLILLPQLSPMDNRNAAEEDALAYNQLDELLKELIPGGCTIERVYMGDFIESGGGALNCISWTRKEHPSRPS